MVRYYLVVDLFVSTVVAFDRAVSAKSWKPLGIRMVVVQYLAMRRWHEVPSAALNTKTETGVSTKTDRCSVLGKILGGLHCGFSTGSRTV